MKHIFWLFLMFSIVLTGCSLLSRADQPVIVVDTFRGDFSLGALYAIHSDGSHASGIPAGLGDDPQWSKDGKWIVLRKHNFFDFNATQIILMRANGSHRIPLTEYGYNRSPSWSPDVHTIAYESGNIIYILDVGCLLDGKKLKDCPLNPRRLTAGNAPDWDPTGKKIVFNTIDYSTYESYIQVINADGTGPIETFSPSGIKNCYNPKWSPDGEEIVFGCGGEKIYRILKDGALITSYLDLGISGDEPLWAPDGERIFFTSMMGDDLGEPVNMEGTVISNALYSMKPDGSDLLRLTSRNDEYIRWFALMP
jgi:Tol biopolymer transport system component